MDRSIMASGEQRGKRTAARFAFPPGTSRHKSCQQARNRGTEAVADKRYFDALLAPVRNPAGIGLSILGDMCFSAYAFP